MVFGKEIKLKLEPRPTTRRVRIRKVSDDEITIRHGRGFLGTRMASIELFDDHLVINTSEKPMRVEERIRVSGRCYTTRPKVHTLDKKCERVRIVLKYPEE